MEKWYVVAALAAALAVRELWNTFTKRKLKKENAKLKEEKLLRELEEWEKRTNETGNNYRDLRDAYRRSTDPTDDDSGPDAA
jgi:hypothetical protein